MKKSDDLMYDFRAGSEIAFKHFMKQHIHALTFHAYKICRSKEVAEEIVADTFSKLWQRKDHFESEINIKSFLYITTRNACFDHIKSAKQQNNKLSVELNEDLILRDTDPLTHLIHAELIKLLVEEINQLPQRQGDVFRMFYLEGLTTDEICIRLNVTPNAVFLAKKKAIAAIRDVFSRKDLFAYILLSKLLFIDEV
ncbi:sigma-70 family RNA polymerase sigma factor [Pedobacter sp.]|uniref:RNA polymerase sigma factor n=1 Tax=Pedobacter sp. TaxID=1411316 RepID=UPI0031DDAF1E